MNKRWITYKEGYTNKEHDASVAVLVQILTNEFIDVEVKAPGNSYKTTLKREDNSIIYWTPDIEVRKMPIPLRWPMSIKLRKHLRFIPDFLIEVDGRSHEGRERTDRMRDEWFADNFGVASVRFLTEEPPQLEVDYILQRLVEWNLFFAFRGRNPTREEIV